MLVDPNSGQETTVI
jgi:hypothetical protein